MDDASTDGPAPEAYGRVTNPERFAPLHAAADALVARLATERDVRVDEMAADAWPAVDAERLLRVVRLTTSDDGAAPLSIAWTSFPGVRVQAGRWYEESFPGCGCDACDERPGAVRWRPWPMRDARPG